ncbi:MAG: helix-turn-helix domain-containing protein [Mycobacterium sp.]
MSALKFRNLGIDPSTPVGQWGVEGLLAAIDRGSLPDWRRIAAAVDAEPWGPVAADLIAAIELAEDRGVAATLERAIARARRRAEDQARAEVCRRLTTLVAESGYTAAEFAGRLGTSPSRLSTYLSGKVVPSAALLVRAEGVAARP